MYFPMFVDMQGKNCLVAGGGRVALRKINMMLDFGMEVTVIAPCIREEIRAIKKIQIKERRYEREDLQGRDMVIAATDQEWLNSEIAEECKKRKIWVNHISRPEEGTFICPAYIRSGSVTTAFSSGGKSPVVAQYLKNQMLPFMTEELALQAEYLGEIRETVKNIVSDSSIQKQVYDALLQFCQREHRRPEEPECRSIIRSIQKVNKLR